MKKGIIVQTTEHCRNFKNIYGSKYATLAVENDVVRAPKVVGDRFFLNNGRHLDINQAEGSSSLWPEWLSSRVLLNN